MANVYILEKDGITEVYGSLAAIASRYADSELGVSIGYLQRDIARMGGNYANKVVKITRAEFFRSPQKNKASSQAR